LAEIARDLRGEVLPLLLFPAFQLFDDLADLLLQLGDVFLGVIVRLRGRPLCLRRFRRRDERVIFLYG